MALDKIVDVARSLSCLARTGWMLRGIPPQIAETSGSHSFMAALLALEIAFILANRGEDVDPYRAAVIALVHELPEAYVGDIVREFSRRIGVENKEGIELSVVEERIGDSKLASLFREFVEQSSIEAHVAKLAELLATMVQAILYMKQGYSSVKDIYEGSWSEVERLSKQLGIWDIVEDLLFKLKER